MNVDPKTEPPTSTERAMSLSQLLGRSRQVVNLMEECAVALASVNAFIKQTLAASAPPPDTDVTYLNSAAVEKKLLHASALLSAVNRTLREEAREREMLDHQYAAAVEQEAAARRAALHDVLTGLPNRTLFNVRLEHGIAQARRHGRNLAVMFVDLDNFKTINDSQGHDAGDQVLATIARRLTETTRGDDTVSRHGGDEFLYLALETGDEATIALIAEKLIRAIQMPCDVTVGGREAQLCVTASIGISIYPNDGTTVDSLIDGADKAMYLAKQNQSRYLFAT